MLGLTDRSQLWRPAQESVFPALSKENSGILLQILYQPGGGGMLNKTIPLRMAGVMCYPSKSSAPASCRMAGLELIDFLRRNGNLCLPRVPTTAGLFSVKVCNLTIILSLILARLSLKEEEEEKEEESCLEWNTRL